MNDRLLRDVSRSFHLSIRVLPRPMRRPVGLAYLLARASDTLADTPGVDADEKLALLDGFAAEVDGGPAGWRGDPGPFLERQTHAGEKALIAALAEVFDALDALPGPEAAVVRDVVRTIVGGQRLDVERAASGAFRMPDAGALEDYCHRVAGCVGQFWTRIGFLTLGGRFSGGVEGDLDTLGERFGRGLQLVNILRDLARDLDHGRCYLPVDPAPDAMLAAAAEWRQIARRRMDDGLDYARRLRGARLRTAVALPALIGLETLDLLDAADWPALAAGVKVDRATVRRCAWQALILR